MFGGRATTVLAFLLGLLIATAGTATAARLITGKQIKDGSITSRDLSKGLRAQIAKAAKPGVPGAKGAPGEQGPKGDQGPQGDRTHVVTRATRTYTDTGGVPSGPFTAAVTLPGFGTFETSCISYFWIPTDRFEYQADLRLRNTTGATLVANGSALGPSQVSGVLLTTVDDSSRDAAKSLNLTLIDPSTDRIAEVVAYLGVTPTGCDIRSYARVRSPGPS
jgi:hypothetical protein